MNYSFAAIKNPLFYQYMDKEYKILSMYNFGPYQELAMITMRQRCR